MPVKFPKKKTVPAYTRIYMKSDLLFTTIGGMAGSKIYNYLRWQTGMNGKNHYAITNDYLAQYKINPDIVVFKNVEKTQLFNCFNNKFRADSIW